MKSLLRTFVLIGLTAAVGLTAEAKDNNGRIAGNVSDFLGGPVQGALVRIVQLVDGVENYISTRSDEYGFFKAPALAAGVYSLYISHQDYQPVTTTQFIVDGSHSVSLEIALQKFADSFTRDEDPRNQGFRQVLRGVSDRRLIFRVMPIYGADENAPDPFTQGGVMSITSGSPQGESYFLGQHASQSGVSSNFAFTEPLNPTSRIVLSGQMDSGSGSFWRLRNTYSRRLDKDNNYSISVGFGRMSGNHMIPDSVSSSTNFLSMTDGLETFSFGTEGETRLFNILAIRYGIDYSKLHYDSDKSLFSPSLRILLTPADGWSFEAFVSSKPQSDNNSITLPSGETINLAEPTLITIAGNKVSMNQVRHSEAVLKKHLTSEASIEFAYYQDYISGPGIPLLVTTRTPSQEQQSCVIEANADHSSQRGLRLMAKHRIFEHLTGSIAYIYGESKEIAHDTRQATIASLVENPENFMRQGYRSSVAGRVDAFIPMTRTNVIAMLRWNSGYPLTTLDRFFDDMDIGTKSANLEIRQIVPMPTFMYGSGRWEVMFELRNALNQGSKKLTAADGEIIFDRNPRFVRFGLNYSFH